LVSSLAVGVATGLVASLWLAAPGAAQSKRYPPTPVDKDAEKAAQSGLWNAAINPERHPYQDLVHSAAEALNQRTPDQTLEAIKKLDEAVRLLPREAEAYRLRGDAQLSRRDWVHCAADFAAAEAYTPRDDEPARAMAELRRKLGVCQARAGKLSDAEKTLAETAASGNGSGEVWTRLGEVRIALGKLDEAIAALRSALDTTEPAAQAMIHFMLAAAYDRARRPADALQSATDGSKLDPQLSVLQNPQVPPLGAGELDYMLGLAYGVDPARPEYQLAHFRRFIAAAPESPWRKRADDHIRELKASELPDNLMRKGPQPPELDVVRTGARRLMPQMRACLAKYPAVVVEVEISRAGPRTPPSTDRMRPRFFPPPDGTTVRLAVGTLPEAALDAVDRCLQPLAARLTLPTVKEHDTFYKAAFYVVGL
jgi:tetratricopeptide (TPR) repeat protein